MEEFKIGLFGLKSNKLEIAQRFIKGESYKKHLSLEDSELNKLICINNHTINLKITTVEQYDSFQAGIYSYFGKFDAYMFAMYINETREIEQTVDLVTKLINFYEGDRINFCIAAYSIDSQDISQKSTLATVYKEIEQKFIAKFLKYH